MDPKTVASIPLLAALKPRAQQQALRTAREQFYRPGDVLVAQGAEMAVPMLEALIRRLHQREEHGA